MAFGLALGFDVAAFGFALGFDVTEAFAGLALGFDVAEAFAGLALDFDFADAFAFAEAERLEVLAFALALGGEPALERLPDRGVDTRRFAAVFASSVSFV